MSVPEIYVKLIVGFPRDPKVRRLIQYGAEAGLCRDLYVSMVLYCKENLSDGYVPAEEVGVLAYPLPVDHANQLAKQLGSVELITEVSNGEQQGWIVNAYLKRNGTKKDVEELSRVRAEAGRKGGRPPRITTRQGHAQANINQIGKQVAKQNESRPNPETESETESKDQSSRRNQPSPGDPPRLTAVAELADRFGHVLDDNDLLSAAIKTIHARTARSIESADARRIAADILSAAKRPPGNPVAYVTKAIEREKDPAGRWLNRPGEYQPAMLVALPSSSVPPEQHDYEPDAYGTCIHDGCGLPENNQRHRRAS